MNPTRALTRVGGLEVDELADGCIVYQPARDRAHNLNRTAAGVFALCDGRTPADEIPARVQAAWRLAEPPVEAVRQCPARLVEEGFVVPV